MKSNAPCDELLVLKPLQKLPLMGQMVVKVLSGRVHVYGRILNPTDSPQYLVSSPSTSLLYIENPSADKPAEVRLSSIWNGMEGLKMRNGCRFIGFDPVENIQPLSYKLAVPEGTRLLEFPQSWWDIVVGISSYMQDNPQLPPRILILGNRKVGKSSLCRFITNSLLNTQKTVAFMDLDCGQTEFTPPGFLSLKLLTDALLGPPPRHAGLTDSCKYIGIAGVDSGVRLYCESSKDLFLEYQSNASSKDLPLIVNTLGWTTGLGFMLQQYIIQTMRPTHLIVVKNASHERPEDDTIPDYVWDLLYGKSELGFASCEPYSLKDIINVAAASSPVASGKDNERPRADPSDLRDLMWLAYFQQQTTSNGIRYDFSKQLSGIIPFSISWDEVSIVIIPSQSPVPYRSILSLLNGSVVGLALEVSHETMPGSTFKFGPAHGLPRILKALRGTSLPTCYGAALIRSVDPVSRLFHILTPMPLERLISERINALIFNPGFIIPRSIVLQAHEGPAIVPYVSTLGNYSGAAANVRKVRGNINRRYRPNS